MRHGPRNHQPSRHQPPPHEQQQHGASGGDELQRLIAELGTLGDQLEQIISTPEDAL